MLVIGGGFRALIAWVGLRSRRSTGGNVEQAKRGLLFYSALAMAGLILMAIYYLIRP